MEPKVLGPKSQKTVARSRARGWVARCRAAAPARPPLAGPLLLGPLESLHMRILTLHIRGQGPEKNTLFSTPRAKKGT